jgi:uncharacterized lipoprotein
MNINTAISLSLIALFLGACSQIHNRETEYTEASSIPELKIPTNVAAEQFNNSYPIPSIPGNKPVEAADLSPPGLSEAEEKAEQETINAKNKEENT